MKKPAANPPDRAEPGDAALFRATVGEVRPLAGQNRITPKPAPRLPFRSPNTVLSIPDTLNDSAAGNAPEAFLSNGISRMTLRKLRRGGWPIEDRLDLHGLHSDAARRLLQEFLHEAMQREMRCVLVIHGKGMNSPGGEALLRRLSRHWLEQHPGVLGFCDAQPREGGSGAVLVLLKASP